MSAKNPTFQDPLVIRAFTKAMRIARSTRLGLSLFRLKNRHGRLFCCPVCHYEGPFVTLHAVYGERKYAECPRCGALERHRLLSLVLDEVEKSVNLQGKTILHFAPEPFFQRRFKALTQNYTSTDLVMRGVDMRVDIGDLPFATASQDLIFASYILQYVQDDMRALREIHRVLRPGGIAILPVTIVAEKTVEYPEPNLHESGGHIRAPGFDYYERFKQVFDRVDLHESGDFPDKFQLHVYEDRTHWPTPEMPLRQAMAGIQHKEIIPVCRR
jgi:SAM-dependent methyltransferase